MDGTEWVSAGKNHADQVKDGGQFDAGRSAICPTRAIILGLKLRLKALRRVESI
jgi:hypothetical protein